MGNCVTNAPPPAYFEINGERMNVGHEVAFCFPPWCLRTIQLDNHVTQVVKATWQKVMSGDCEPFKEVQSRVPNITPLVYFYNTFYDSFFSLSPESKPLFHRGIHSQGRMLAHIINFIVHNIERRDLSLDATLRHLAVLHNQRGISAETYSTMGLCLLFSLRKCSSDDNFDAPARFAWTALYSYVMMIMLPIVARKQMHTDATELHLLHDYKQRPSNPISGYASASPSNSDEDREMKPVNYDNVNRSENTCYSHASDASVDPHTPVAPVGARGSFSSPGPQRIRPPRTPRSIINSYQPGLLPASSTEHMVNDHEEE